MKLASALTALPIATAAIQDTASAAAVAVPADALKSGAARPIERSAETDRLDAVAALT